MINVNFAKKREARKNNQKIQTKRRNEIANIRETMQKEKNDKGSLVEAAKQIVIIK